MAWSNHILSAFWRALPRLVAVVVLGSIALPLGATKDVHAAGCYVRGAPLFVSSKNFAEHDVALTESGATIKAYIGNTLGTVVSRDVGAFGSAAPAGLSAARLPPPAKPGQVVGHVSPSS